ncbi:WD repeat-containing protein 17 [Borealophlyctis nickersoniae]|nr:WD repeat-containing protein 17 [Borealophlyctis nickersoniae]
MSIYIYELVGGAVSPDSDKSSSRKELPPLKLHRGSGSLNSGDLGLDRGGGKGDGEGTAGTRASGIDEVKLLNIVGEHKSNVTAIAWHPTDINRCASVSTDRTLRIWHVVTGICLASYPTSIEKPVSTRDTIMFDGHITTADWNPKVAGLLAVGDAHGTIYICQIPSVTASSRKTRPTKRKVDLPQYVRIGGDETGEGGSSSGEDVSVVEVRWDPKSEGYLIAAFKNGMDSEQLRDVSC